MASTLLSSLCWADQPVSTGLEGPAGTAFGYGKQEWAIAAGYGFGLGLNGDCGCNLKDIRYAALVPRWGIGLTDPLAEESWYRGNLDLLLEGAFLFAYQPEHGFAGGATLMFRYNFLKYEHLVPFVEAGAGILGTDLDLRGSVGRL